jgi:HNH endonuclease
LGLVSRCVAGGCGHVGENESVTSEPTLWESPAVLTTTNARGRRARTGTTALPLDAGTSVRFLAKCAPPDDRGHRWWLGAIDGGADCSGGYGRFQAGIGAGAVITTAHRYAWTLEHGPVAPGLVLRHRCDEPLCTATADLELGTEADNYWDTVARPVRAADRDTRGSAGRSRAIRRAVLGVLATGVTSPAVIGRAVRAAMAEGDPDRDQLALWAASDL